MKHRRLFLIILIFLQLAAVSHANITDTATTTCSDAQHSSVEDEKLLGEDMAEVILTILFKTDSLDRKLSFSKYVQTSVKSRSAFPPFGERFIHLYDDPEDLRDAGGPEVDQEQCLVELKELGDRVEQFNSQKLQSKDLNIRQLLDTWGQRPSGVLLGNYIWPGMYGECRRLKIRTLDNRRLDTRYCMAYIKFHDWPRSKPEDSIATAVCLPKVCDSIDYKSKYKIIEKLIQFDPNVSVNLTHLYCLPDRQSRLQIWWMSPPTVAYVGLLGLWFTLLLYSTYTNTFKSLSITYNLGNLLSLSQKSSPAENRLVDLSVVDGIKVLTSCFVIYGHVLVVCEQLMSNWREMVPNGLANIAFVCGNLIPAIGVNAFFTMSGLLITYSSFKRSAIPLATQPIQWLSFVWIRYMRIMPYYALVVAYSKYLAKYTGSGPFWDYATAFDSLRGYCEREPWHWTLTFMASWLSPFGHCLAAAWYLADDFYFAVVTPIFFQVLHWKPKLGKQTLLATSLLSFTLSSLNLLNTEGDMRSILGFMPHAYKTSLNGFIDNYTNPHYRVPAYLMGILIGYYLYEFELGNLKARQNGKQKPTWPNFLTKYGQILSLVTIVGHFIFAIIADGTIYSRKIARYLVALMTPLSYASFGTAAGVIALLASTGYANKWITSFLSWPIFKPLARISLPVLLINLEVLSYFLQISQQMIYSDLKSVIGLWLFAILLSYLLSIMFYVFFEAPISSLVNRVTPNLSSSKSQKRK